MFSLYEWSEMLKELGLGDNNKIMFTHFKIHGMPLDDGFVPLMTNVDVIKLLNYVTGCKEIEVYIETDVSLVELHLVELVVSQSHIKGVGNGVVIKEIVEDNVVSSSGKESGMLMLEWYGMGKEEVISRSGKESRLSTLEWPDMGKEDKHVDTSTHASTSDVCPVVEPRNDEHVGNLDCDNENAGDIHEKVHETLMDDDLFQKYSVVDWQEEACHIVDEQQDIAEFFNELNHLGEDVFSQTSGAQVEHAHDVDKEDVDMEENVDANLDQFRMTADMNWQDFGLDVVDMEELYSGDVGGDKQPPQIRKRIL
ncbi:hypothetical protein Tco_1338025 [Tanacetum coccineum]